MAWDVMSSKKRTYHYEINNIEPSIQPPIEETTRRKLVEEEQLRLWGHRPHSGPLLPFLWSKIYDTTVNQFLGLDQIISMLQHFITQNTCEPGKTITWCLKAANLLVRLVLGS